MRSHNCLGESINLLNWIYIVGVHIMKSKYALFSYFGFQINLDNRKVSQPCDFVIGKQIQFSDFVGKYIFLQQISLFCIMQDTLFSLVLSILHVNQDLVLLKQCYLIDFVKYWQGYAKIIQQNHLTLNIMESRPKIKLNSGNFIPALGFGTYQLKKGQCISSVTEALKSGYIHIDTASVYKNQAQINHFDRNNLYITSKISPSEQGYQNTITAVEGIIQRLGVKYLDLLLIHWPGVAGLKPQALQNSVIRLQTWRAMEQLKENQLIRDIGVSNFREHHLQHLLKQARIVPAVNQIQVHPLLREKNLVQYCKTRGIAIQAYSPLARSSKLLLENTVIQQIALLHNKKAAQVCLRWSIQNGFIVLPKSKTPKYIHQNINIFDFELSQQEMQKINSLDQNLHTCWDSKVVTI